ncbi:hypothetical protein [Pigmentiphaga daeguensis]|uniref:Uncharacterized protein n=1 Tax=Pigmentiphaga daeguensis TaxID=414049 RepID=A0ABN1D3Y1_9BURK
MVISNLQIPADQMTLTRSLTLKASDCIRFDAVLWHDAKRSERFSNLSLCAPELPKQSNNFVLTWKSFSISGKTSGQVRTDGPIPPYSKLPSDPAMERWLMNQFGLYYVGSLLTLVGYDPNFTVDEGMLADRADVRGSAGQRQRVLPLGCIDTQRCRGRPWAAQ